MSHKSILLLSGGLDSTVAAALSLRHARPLLALTVNYGQKAFAAEKDAAAYFAKGWGCEQRIVDVPWLGKLAPNALTDPRVQLESYTEGVDDSASQRAKRLGSRPQPGAGIGGGGARRCDGCEHYRGGVESRGGCHLPR